MKKSKQKVITGKRLGAVFAGILCIPILCLSAMAEEEEYEGVKLDPVTGQAVSDDVVVDTEETTDDLIHLDSDCAYSADEQLYYYSCDSYTGYVVSCNVESGTYTNDAVSVTVTDGIGWKLYRDGTELNDADISEITDVGSYTLEIVSNSNHNEQLIRFTIVGEYTSLSVIEVPTDCNLIRLEKDGTLSSDLPDTISLTEEGKYVITWQNPYTDVVTTCTTTVDRTAPELKLEAVDADGRARSSVDISDLEENADIEILLDGKEISYSQTLEQSGVYDITVTDLAGNSNTYHFVILIHINNQGMVFLTLIVLLTAGLIIYLIVSKNRMKVR